MNREQLDISSLESYAESLEDQIREAQRDLDAIRRIIARSRPANPREAADKPLPEEEPQPSAPEPVTVVIPPLFAPENQVTDPDWRFSAEDLPTRQVKAEYTRPNLDLSDLAVNFTGTTNTLERIIRIGEVAGEDQLLNITEISHLLVAAGVSQAKVSNLRTNVDHAIRDNPDLFEKVSPGTYRYRRPARGQ